jgi:hypothetical protein
VTDRFDAAVMNPVQKSARIGHAGEPFAITVNEGRVVNEIRQAFICGGV